MQPLKPNPPTPLPPPCWEVIEHSLHTEGDPAYRCALRIVYDWCYELAARIAQLEAQIPARWNLPGSIPASGVTHMPSGIDRLAMGEES